jgi:hypothetical protein
MSSRTLLSCGDRNFAGGTVGPDTAASGQRYAALTTGNSTRRGRRTVRTVPAHDPALQGGRLTEPAAAEQGCCAFLDFTLHLTPSALQLTVRAPEGAAGMLNDLFAEAA